MSKFLNNISLKLEIALVSIFLLILMIVASMNALTAMRSIGGELESVAFIDIPLTEGLNHVTQKQLQQAIHMEKGFRIAEQIRQGHGDQAALNHERAADRGGPAKPSGRPSNPQSCRSSSPPRCGKNHARSLVSFGTGSV